MSYFLHLLIYFNMYVVLAMSLNLLAGYCGLLTLAHAAYFAVGAYTYALATTVLGLTFLPALLLGAALASALSLLVSLPAMRLRGDYFVLASLAVQSWFFSVIQNWSSPDSEPGTWANLTNGSFGIAGLPRPDVFGLPFRSLEGVAILSCFFAATAACVVWLLVASPWGRRLQAIRDDEKVCRGLGKRVGIARLQVFSVSCSLAAATGVVYASYVGFVDPSSASLDESILLLCIVVVGGLGNFRGPIVGAAVLLTIPEILRFAQIPDSVAADLRMIVYGLLLVVLMHVRPQGLAGVYRIE